MATMPSNRLSDIIEFIPSPTTLQNLFFRNRADFFDRTQLKGDIQLTEIGQYAHLLKQIEDHRAYLQQERSDSPSFETAAQDWYKTIYRPLCTIIRRGRLVESLPGRSVADLYAYITVHQWETGRRRWYDSSIDEVIPNDMEAFRKNGIPKNQGKPDGRGTILRVTAEGQHLTGFLAARCSCRCLLTPSAIQRPRKWRQQCNLIENWCWFYERPLRL